MPRANVAKLLRFKGVFIAVQKTTIGPKDTTHPFVAPFR